MITTKQNLNFKIRRATLADLNPCAQIIHDAFTHISNSHGYPSDFPNLDKASMVVSNCLSDPMIYGMVAELDGRIVGSNFIEQRDGIYGIGPISVAPKIQHQGIGRALMQAAILHGKDAAGIRLMQDAYNTMSVALYASLGFDIKEPLLLMHGIPKNKFSHNLTVKKFAESDLEECAALCKDVIGFERKEALLNSLDIGSAFVALRDNKIVAYTTAITLWVANHTVAKREEDLFALLLGAHEICQQPLSFLLPSRQTNILRWCLSEGLRVMSPRTLMAMGEYQEPRGCYFPSVLY